MLFRSNAAIGAGITLRLRAVQIICLVESGGTAESFGFDEEEGYAADAETASRLPIPFDGSSAVIDAGDF